MTQAFNQARTLEQAGKQSASCDTNLVAAVSEDKSEEVSFTLAAAPKKVFSNRSKDGQEKCFFRGNVRHPRSNCPARNSECGKCKQMGRWLGVASLHSILIVIFLLLFIMNCLTYADDVKGRAISYTKCEVDGVTINAMIDSGSISTFMNKKEYGKEVEFIRYP